MGATGTPVAYVQFAPAVATAQEAHEQPVPGPDRGHGVIALPGHGVPSDHPLMLLVRSPVNIPLVMIREKHAALGRSTRRALSLLQLTLDQHGLDGAPPPYVGAGVEGIAEQIADQTLRRNLPDDARPTDRVGGELHVVITKPLERLAHAPALTKLCEDEANGVADPPVRMQHHVPHGVPRIADG